MNLNLTQTTKDNTYLIKCPIEEALFNNKDQLVDLNDQFKTKHVAKVLSSNTKNSTNNFKIKKY